MGDKTHGLFFDFMTKTFFQGYEYAIREKDRIYIFDTTLRDGEQSPGASMNTEEKLIIARQLEKLGVDIIEAGFPIASDGDFHAVGK